MVMKRLTPSRDNKRQLTAYLDPGLVFRVKRYGKMHELSLTEMIAMAVNAAVSAYGAGPILQVSRERLVFRMKSPSQVLTTGPRCRTGTQRVAAYYKVPDLDRLSAFCKEKGVAQESLVDTGLRMILGEQPATGEAA